MIKWTEQYVWEARQGDVAMRVSSRATGGYLWEAVHRPLCVIWDTANGGAPTLAMAQEAAECAARKMLGDDG